MRIYDPRLGRFLSVDPLMKGFAMLTPYQYASNSPLSHIDLDGEEGIWYIHAKTGVYGPTVAKIVNGTEDGVKTSVTKTWNFISNDMWRGETWKQTGLFLEEAALGMSTVKIAETPRVDAAVQSFEDEVINGDAYSRSKFAGQLGTDILTAYVSSKGLGAIKDLAIAKYMSGTFTIGTKTLAKVTSHLEGMGFAADEGNQIMLSRMQKISSKKMKATQTDINFAKHELREAEFMKGGKMSYEEAHHTVLKEQGMGGMNVAEYEKKLYTQEALDASNAAWEKEINKK